MPYTVTNISETTQLSNLVLQKTIGFIGIVKNIPNAGIMVVWCQVLIVWLVYVSCVTVIHIITPNKTTDRASGQIIPLWRPGVVHMFTHCTRYQSHICYVLAYLPITVCWIGWMSREGIPAQDWCHLRWTESRTAGLLDKWAAGFAGRLETSWDPCTYIQNVCYNVRI